MHKFLITIYLCIFACIPVCSARPWLALFGSQDCDQCAAIKAEWHQLDWSAGDPALVFIDIDAGANYDFLDELENRLGYAGKFAAFPIVWSGTTMADGTCFWELAESTDAQALAGLTADLPPVGVIQQFVDASEASYLEWVAPSDEQPESSQALPALQSPRLLYISTPGCQKCARQEVELKRLAAVLPELEVAHYEATTPEGQIMLTRLCRHFQIQAGDRNLAPVVAWAEGYISNELLPRDRLAELLATADGGEPPFWLAPITVQERQEFQQANQTLLKNMTLTTTLLGGLVDGINPCAFATVIFLISYLLYLKRGKRFVLMAGLLFCAGVFLSYLLFGVGLSFLVDYLNSFPVIRRVFYWAFALVGVVLAILHLRDAIRYRRTGNAADMDMGLNAGIHRKIHDRIHRWAEMTGWVAVPGTVVLGVVVSGMEFVCTGQIYLPIIAAINSSGFNLKAFLLLVIYNLAFILPLLGVTVLAYFSVGAKELAAFARTHVFATKLLMTALFLLLAVVMLLLALRTGEYISSPRLPTV